MWTWAKVSSVGGGRPSTELPVPCGDVAGQHWTYWTMGIQMCQKNPQQSKKVEDILQLTSASLGLLPRVEGRLVRGDVEFKVVIVRVHRVAAIPRALGDPVYACKEWENIQNRRLSHLALAALVPRCLGQ